MGAVDTLYSSESPFLRERERGGGGEMKTQSRNKRWFIYKCLLFLLGKVLIDSLALLASIWDECTNAHVMGVLYVCVCMCVCVVCVVYM